MSSTAPGAHTPTSPPTGESQPRRNGPQTLSSCRGSLNITVVQDGELTTSGGTSASAPIFAAMLTAVNDARIAVGKSPVGWINPAVRLRPLQSFIPRTLTLL